MKYIMFFAIAVMMVSASSEFAKADETQTFVVRATAGVGESKLAPKPRSHSFYSDFGGTVYQNQVTGYRDVSSYLRSDGMKVVTVRTYSITNSFVYKQNRQRIPQLINDPKGPTYKYVEGPKRPFKRK